MTDELEFDCRLSASQRTDLIHLLYNTLDNEELSASPAAQKWQTILAVVLAARPIPQSKSQERRFAIQFPPKTNG